MSDTKQLIHTLDQKVEQLLLNIKEQKSALAAKTDEVNALNDKLTASESEIKKLQSENEALKNTPVESSNDSEDMKVRINELVKEIDDCISLLKV